MRAGDPPVRYLVGTPKDRLTRLEKSFAGLPWRGVRESVEVKLLAEDGELHVLAQSRARIAKERGMRHRLKKLWRRLHELRGQSLKRDELLLKLGAAKKEAGRAYHLVEIRLPAADDSVTPETFTFALRRDRLRRARRREGRYLLRSNLAGEDPATLWRAHRDRAGLQGTQARPRRPSGLPPARGSDRGAHPRRLRRLLPARHPEEPGAAARPGPDARCHSREVLHHANVHHANGGCPSADHRRTAPRAAPPYRPDPRSASAASSTRPGTAPTAAPSNLRLTRRPRQPPGTL